MMNQAVTDPLDPLDTCPYDKAHRIIRSRMQPHLVKCRKNFRCSDKKICLFNTTHVVNAIEYDYHILHCPGSNSYYIALAQDTELPRTNNFIPVEETNNKEIESSENWDLDPEVPTYCPLTNIQNRAVHITPACLSKAKRKQFKEAERMRFVNAEDNKEKFFSGPNNGAQHLQPQISDTYPDDFGISQLSLGANKTVQKSARVLSKFDQVNKEYNKTHKTEASKKTVTKTSKKDSCNVVLQNQASYSSSSEATEVDVEEDSAEWESVSRKKGTKQRMHSSSSSSSAKEFENDFKGMAKNNQYMSSSLFETKSNMGNRRNENIYDETLSSNEDALSEIQTRLLELSTMESEIQEERQKLNKKFEQCTSSSTSFPSLPSVTCSVKSEDKVASLKARLAANRNMMPDKLGGKGRGSVVQNMKTPGQAK